MRYAMLGLMLFASACEVRSPVEARMDPYAPSQISFASQDLRSRTAVGLPRTERRNGILYVTVPIRAASEHDLHIDYRVTFFNEQGTPIYRGQWEQGPTLESNVFSEITFNSPSGDAADFRLDVRYAQ